MMGEYIDTSEPPPPPHSIEAEQGLLGCVLINADEMPAAVEQLGRYDSHFYDPRHRTLWPFLVKLWEQQVPIDDLLVLISHLKDAKVLEQVGGQQYLSELPDKTPSAANASYYLTILSEKYALRQAVKTAEEITLYVREARLPVAKIINMAADALEALRTRSRSTGETLTVRQPDEILAMQFPDRRVLADGLLEEGASLAIVGAGGLGKSRFTLQLAAATILGRPCCGLETRGQHLRWLFLQAENSNPRLKEDFTALRSWAGKGWPRVNEQLRIHTLESELDSIVSLDNPENVRRIEALILESAANVVVWDSLYNFGIGDLNKDTDMRATLFTISRVTRKGDPMRTPLVLHHALTGKAGAAKAVGFDRASFGRNSKLLHQWTRGQLNVAPGTSDYRTLVLACGKISNGREFPPFAVTLSEAMIYEPAPNFDVAGWEAEMTGTKSENPKVAPELVRELCDGKTKKALVTAIMDETGCGKSLAYRVIERAEKMRLVACPKALGTYARR